MARANRNSRFLRGLGFWSWRRDLNPRPSDYKSDALPAELRQPEQPHTPVSKDTNASAERGVQIERLSHTETYCNLLHSACSYHLLFAFFMLKMTNLDSEETPMPSKLSSRVADHATTLAQVVRFATTSKHPQRRQITLAYLLVRLRLGISKKMGKTTS